MRSRSTNGRWRSRRIGATPRRRPTGSRPHWPATSFKSRSAPLRLALISVELLESTQPSSGALAQLISADAALGQRGPQINGELAQARGDCVEHGIGPLPPPPQGAAFPIREQTLGSPPPFITIPMQFVLVYLELGQQVFHGPQFSLDRVETGEQRKLQPFLRFRRAAVQAAHLAEMTL